MEALRADIDRHAAQIATIRTRYEADRKRFIELTESGCALTLASPAFLKGHPQRRRGAEARV